MKTQANKQMSKIMSKLISKENLLLVFLFGILLIVIAMPLNNKKESKKQEITNENDLPLSYTDTLEKKLEAALKCTGGVGETKVLITLKDTGKKETLFETKSSKSMNSINDEIFEETQDNEIVYTDIDGDRVPFIANEYTPEIQGVIIVAKGAGDATVVKDITDAVSALLGISINKIKVLKMEV